ncbi:hypothetical protein DCC79_07900 [bacterium]|nr:hypothetical protein [Chloroflexi bacterium CFX6]RIL10461.1 MAG: hypothetical protein DCC79_07900 [bacterium]
MAGLRTAPPDVHEARSRPSSKPLHAVDRVELTPRSRAPPAVTIFPPPAICFPTAMRGCASPPVDTWTSALPGETP